MEQNYTKATLKQISDLQALVEKTELNDKEIRRYHNLRIRLKNKGIMGLPFRPTKKRGRKPDLVVVSTMANEYVETPAGVPLFNCFKEISPGQWERDGADLTIKQAKETVKDIRREGFKAIIKPVSMGYVFKENS